MEDSKHWGSRGQRASIVQVRTRKLAEANGGEKQMSCLNMKPESESLYRGGFVFIHPLSYHSFLGFLIFLWLSPTSWMTTWWGSCRDNVSLLVENEDPLKTGNAMKFCRLVYSSTLSTREVLFNLTSLSYLVPVASNRKTADFWYTEILGNSLILTKQLLFPLLPA